MPSHKSVLPEGLKVDHGHSADEFFARHQEANGLSAPAPVAPAAAAAPVAPVVPPVAAATVAPEPSSVPVKGSMMDKLAAKAKPAAPAVPAPVVPAAPSAANPEDQISLDPKYSPAAHASFAQIKGIAAGLRDQLNAARETERQLKAQLDAAKSATPVPDVAEIEKLRAENKAFSDRLMLVDLREHPKFQSEFVAPQQQALQTAKELLVANGKSDDISRLVDLPRGELGKTLSEITKDLPDLDRRDVTDSVYKAWTIAQQASSALSKSRETYGALRNQTDATQKQAFERTWERSAGHVAEHIVELEVPDDATPEVRASIEADNAAFKGLRTVAEQRAFGPATSEVVAENAIKSAAYDLHIQRVMPRIIKEYDSLLTLNRQLAGELQAIRDRNPNRQIAGVAAGGGGGGLGPDGTLSEAQLSKMTHEEAAAALAPRVGGR
jgi:hypothetical protein